MIDINSMNQSTFPSLTASAVLVPLFKVGNELSLLFTKRTENVRHHKGQICFPGGVRENADTTLWQTALRETHEELGLCRNKITFIGELSEIITPTQYHITPYVGLVTESVMIQPNPGEIAEAFHVRLDFFLTPENLSFESKSYFGTEYKMPVYVYGQHRIWGATGKMVYNLVELIRNRSLENFPYASDSMSLAV